MNLFGNNPLFGADPEGRIVAAEYEENSNGEGIAVFTRADAATVKRVEKFDPFILCAGSSSEGCPAVASAMELSGTGPLNRMLFFTSWNDCLKAKDWFSKSGGKVPQYYFINDPVQQYLMLTGKTLFKDMQFGDLKRMQIDIECIVTDGHEFCNAERTGDRIVAIGIGNPDGSIQVLKDNDEKKLLQDFVAVIREHDPDIIEGHNIFNFDLPYIFQRAQIHKVKMAIGRDGSVPERSAGRFNAAERAIAYQRFDVYGRHVIDTMFMLYFYDISHRSLEGYDLKGAAVHFGVSPKDRTYIEGSKIAETWKTDPAKIFKYVADDIRETKGLADMLSQANFIQAGILPYSYQNVSIRGNATKIDSLMLREYFRQKHAVPQSPMVEEYEGGYADIFVTGMVSNVHHCDVRSLYPSLMLSRKIAPKSDELGIFLRMLELLRDFRLDAKSGMTSAKNKADKDYYSALQSVFKVLINSFYGYLGFSQGHFSDFEAANKVTSDGRELLRDMLDRLRKLEAIPIEIDTDGIYFSPPPFQKAKDKDVFISEFRAGLPDGIEVEFDGEYKSMYSYKVKNYALLDHEGEITIKGAALKSRGMEPYLRTFMSDLIRLRLEGREAEIKKLYEKCRQDVRSRNLEIKRLCKTETLQDSVEKYASKISKSSRNRNAAYELALASGRKFKAGDQVSYYVTGTKKAVTVFQSAKLVLEWNPSARDENVEYYISKLDALYEKFGGSVDDGNLLLDL